MIIYQWQELRPGEHSFYCNPFSFIIFLHDDYADIVAHFGNKSDTRYIQAGDDSLSLAKEWCREWRDLQLAGMNAHIRSL